ncbi:hypothetical protein MKY41_11355 [Sporosarcina sp. FSL W7-1349]|uniref:hypothetical protein n=1 Tax=Sporosarcina sp. FSL W7-1349 TaxID=2921561 RepID=UPI0030F725A9
MTAYQLLVKAIERKSQSEQDLTKKANTFFAFDQLTETEYQDVMDRIAMMEDAA